MSSTNLPNQADKAINEDSIMSNSTNNSLTDSLIQDLTKIKNIFLITKSLEQKLPDILSYLQSDTNIANKIFIVKYLQSLLFQVNYNTEIILRKFSNDKEKLNLYQIIIYQYIFTNPGNTEEEEENYRSELQSLFILMLSHVNLDKETYRYILSFLVNFINEKNISNALKKKENQSNNNDISEDRIIEFKSKHFSRFLKLLGDFYKYAASYNETPNYFFFSGDSDSNITISNRDNLLNFDKHLCIMLFINILPSKFLKMVYPKVIFRLLELRFQDKNKKSININIDIDNRIIANDNKEHFCQLLDSETNCVVIKFYKEKKILKSKIFVGFEDKSFELTDDEKEKELKGKTKDEIKEIVLFKNFIGVCKNIIIYKEEGHDGIPTFLFSLNQNLNKINSKSSKETNDNKKRKSNFNICTLFPNGIYNEELYSNFSKAELNSQIDQGLIKNCKKKGEKLDEFEKFLKKNIISIYIPTRVDIPSEYGDRTFLNTPELILRDAINNLDAEFSTKSPNLNGVHIYSRIENDFRIIGGINNLLPIMEIMANNSEFLTKENFYSYFSLLSNYVFSSQYQNAIIQENNSNFFASLSYFLEKIPDTFFNEDLNLQFLVIMSFLSRNENDDLSRLKKEFINFILMNEKILFKFNEAHQEKILEKICLLVDKRNIKVDIIKIIRILLYYDRNNKNKFCCREHAEYFNGTYSVMDPELSSRIKPIENLLEILFDKKYKLFKENANVGNTKANKNKILINNDTKNYEDNNRLHFIFYLLSFEISPCIQKSIICLIKKMIEKFTYEDFVKIFDKQEKLFDIVLFVFKTSIVDVKNSALDLLLFIETNNKGKNIKDDDDKKIFIKNEIIPTFLLDEVYNLKEDENFERPSYVIIDKENSIIEDKKIENKEDLLNNQEKKEQNENIEKDIINNEEIKDIGNINIEYEEKHQKKEEEEQKKELNEEENKKIKGFVEINKVQYKLFSPTDNQKKLNKEYNKKKFNSLIRDSYDLVYNSITDKIALDLKLDLLIKLVSIGDLSSVKCFLSQISLLNDENEKNKEQENIWKEISKNQQLLHWLIETTFQIYILKNTEKNSNFKPFISGFSIETYSDEVKKDLYNKIYNQLIKLIYSILNINISKADYLLTWGKYYLELIESNGIFNHIYNFINDIFIDLFSISSVTSFSNMMALSDTKVKNTLYFFNLFFELFSFYHLKYHDSNSQNNSKEISEEVIMAFISVLLNKNQKTNKLEPREELDFSEKKISFWNSISFFSINILPIWTKSSNVEKEEFSKQILSKSNTFINLLEILFYDFSHDFFTDNDYSGIGNKGIPLILIIYHFFIGFFNVGGEINELTQKFQEFRKFIKQLIISSTTLNSAETSKKKKWPKEEQYREVQDIVESILFKTLFYCNKKIKQYNTDLDNYNLEKKKEEEKNEKTVILENINKNIECLLKLKRLYLENMGYLLKLLNSIYVEIKSDLKQKKNLSSFFVNIFKSKSEGAKQSASFLLMEKIYNESSILNLHESTNNNIRKTVKDNPKSIDKNNEKENNNEQKKERKKKLTKNNSINNFRIRNPEISAQLSNSLNIERNTDLKSNELDKYDNLNLIDRGVNNDLNNSKNNINEIDNEENYLAQISKINFDNNLSNEDLEKLELNINKFLDDKCITTIYEKNKEKYNNYLYSFFMPILEKRNFLMKNIIPIYDNSKNLSSYPKQLCLVPYYYPENKYQNILISKIREIYDDLYKEIEIKNINNEFKEYSKCNIYKNIKKDLFKFNGIWSYQDYFYDNEKYKLKYKLLNHMTNDFTRIMMTPIIDLNYYLPKFSLFKGEMFRNNSENGIMTITKVIDLSFGLDDIEKKNIGAKDSKENVKKDNKSELISNIISNSSSSIINEETEKEGNIINQEIPLYENNHENFSFLKEKEKENKENDNSIFQYYIERTHFHKKIEECCISTACLVKIAFHIRGIIYINDKEIGFYSYGTKRNETDEDFDEDRKACFGSIFKNMSDKYNKYYMSIPLKEIELIFKRRYFFKKNVLEIYTQDKKSYFFRINEKNFDSFFNNLKNYLKDDLEDITIEYSKTEEKIGFINKKNHLYYYNNYNILFNSKKCSSLKNLYSKWTNWEISTFTLLNAMNIYSNRSYNDINQYPVFPWIITEYTSNTIPSLENTNINKNANVTNSNNSSQTPKEKNKCCIRPFDTPMGMLDITEEAKERKEDYQSHWENLEKETDREENYDRYGSHYSTSLYLTYYLVRVFPFSYIRLELQGKKFDDPNRLFNSLSNSFECAITQKADLRELIPEFFCLPEMFYNMNELNFGEIIDTKTKSSIPVNNIEMPPWANKDGYIFIEKHRTFLESIEISEKINEWFNIIFGSKQKGKGAKAIGNLFIKQTYDDFDEIHQKADPNEQIYQKRMVEFGVTPSQIFKYNTNRRYSPKDLRKKKPILYNYQIKVGKKKDLISMYEELEMFNSEIYLDKTPYKMLSALKKNEEGKNEKIIIIYQDKVKIISKTHEKEYLKKGLSKENKENKDKDKNKENKSKDNKVNKENEENPENEENKEIEVNESEENDEQVNKSKNEDINDKNTTKNQVDKGEEYTTNKETYLKFTPPKNRMNISLAPTLTYDKGNYMVLGGFWNGDMLIYSLDELGNKKDKTIKIVNIISTNDLSPITHIKIDFSETFLICTNTIGTLYVFTINNANKGEWFLNKKIQDNQKEITAIAINENLNIFVTCDKDGIINIYTLPKCKLINSYKLNESILPKYHTTNYPSFSRSISNIYIYNSLNIYANEIIISQSPLPCIIIHIGSRKSLLIFSINFHFIKEVNLNYEIVPNGIKKYTDYFSKDYLFIYNKNESTIDVYDLIDFDVIARSKKIEDMFIDFIFSKEMDHALIMVKSKDENKAENARNKTEKRSYKLLILKSSS